MEGKGHPPTSTHVRGTKPGSPGLVPIYQGEILTVSQPSLLLTEKTLSNKLFSEPLEGGL